MQITHIFFFLTYFSFSRIMHVKFNFTSALQQTFVKISSDISRGAVWHSFRSPSCVKCGVLDHISIRFCHQAAYLDGV